VVASRPAYPLYQSRFEHDACGVGFVAACDRATGARVVPLALAGLANLAHRGAFAADGESSDGAGVALPLEPALLRRIMPGARGRPAVAMLFLPAEAERPTSRRRLVATPRRRRTGRDRLARGTDRPSRAGQPMRAARCRIAQAAHPATGRRLRPSSGGCCSLGGGWRSPLPRPGWPTSPSPPAPAGPSSTRASSPAAGWPTSTSTWRGRHPPQPRLLPPALRDQHHPSWALAQPFRLIAHNGEINTVRGNREELRGRRHGSAARSADGCASSASC
jgi:glutamate synthase (NADPH) large chain